MSSSAGKCLHVVTQNIASGCLSDRYVMHRALPHKPELFYYNGLMLKISGRVGFASSIPRSSELIEGYESTSAEHPWI